MALIVVLGDGATYWLAGRSLRPLKEPSAQMKNRTVRNLSEEFPVPPSRDEVADLTVLFNDMSQKLDAPLPCRNAFPQTRLMNCILR